MTNELTTIIFDADHTLYTPESDAAYDAKFRFLANQTGKNVKTIRQAWEETAAAVQETDDPGEWERKRLIADTLEGVGLEPDPRVVEDAYSVFWEAVANDTHAAEGVSGMLRQLKKQGFNLAIATDEFPEPLRIKLGTVLHSTDVDDLFDIIITPRDTGTQKPSKQFYRIIMKELEVFANETIVIGDSWERDLQPAQQLGTTTVLVQNQNQTEDTVQAPDDTDDTTGTVDAPDTDDIDSADSDRHSGYHNVYTDSDWDKTQQDSEDDGEHVSTTDGPAYRIDEVTELIHVLNEEDVL